jgi:hypothetical protein
MRDYRQTQSPNFIAPRRTKLPCIQAPASKATLWVRLKSARPYGDDRGRRLCTAMPSGPIPRAVDGPAPSGADPRTPANWCGVARIGRNLSDLSSGSCARPLTAIVLDIKDTNDPVHAQPARACPSQRTLNCFPPSHICEANAPISPVPGTGPESGLLAKKVAHPLWHFILDKANIGRACGPLFMYPGGRSAHEWFTRLLCFNAR